jgi:hypothetical protein
LEIKKAVAIAKMGEFLRRNSQAYGSSFAAHRNDVQSALHFLRPVLHISQAVSLLDQRMIKAFAQVLYL